VELAARSRSARSSADGLLDPAVVADLRAEFAGGYQADLDRIVELFVASAPARFARVRDAVEQCDPIMLREAAHGLRGSSANLGGTRVSAICMELEALSDRSASEQREALTRLGHVLSLTCVALARELAA